MLQPCPAHLFKKWAIMFITVIDFSRRGIYSFNKYLLSAHCVPGRVLGPRDKISQTSLYLHGAPTRWHRGFTSGAKSRWQQLPVTLLWEDSEPPLGSAGSIVADYSGLPGALAVREFECVLHFRHPFTFLSLMWHIYNSKAGSNLKTHFDLRS